MFYFCFDNEMSLGGTVNGYFKSWINISRTKVDTEMGRCNKLFVEITLKYKRKNKRHAC